MTFARRNAALFSQSVLAVTFSISAARAAEQDWIGPSHTYDSGNWSAPNRRYSTIPGSGDTAVLATYSGITFSVNYDYDGSGFTIAQLSISVDSNSPTATAPATLTIAANTLNATTENIGGYLVKSGGYPAAGNGVVNQSGGINNVTTLNVGNKNYATGTYVLSANGVLNATNENIGPYGAGVFNQSGGTNNVSNILTVGNYNGNLLMSGGSIYAPTMNVGNGTINQNGGTINVTSLQIGTTTYNGSYSGYYGTANISGGSTTVSNPLNLGVYAVYNVTGGFGIGSITQYDAAVGVLNISNTGTFSAPTVEVAADSTLNLNGGILATGNITLDSNVGSFNQSISGAFNWSAGTLDITASTTLDSSSSGLGGFFGSALSIGYNRTLEVTGNEIVGGANAFTLTVGNGATDIVTSTLSFGSRGKLTLNGAPLPSTPSI